MKPTKVPTAPTERQHRSSTTISVFVSCMVISVIGGLSGALLLRNYVFSPVFTDGAQLIKINQDNTTLPVQQGATIVTLLTAATELGKGVIISSDGWIVTLATIIGDQTDVTVALADGRVFPVEQRVADPYSQTVFFKITAKQLPVVNFTSETITVGEPIIFYTRSLHSGDRITFGHIENPHFNEATSFTTTKMNLLYLTDHVSQPAYLGSPVFNQAGDMIGLNTVHQLIIPVDAIASALLSVFSTEQVNRPTLDISYQPLYRLVDSETTQPGKGILVTASSTPELLNGDIITTFNDLPLNNTNDFSTLLQNVEIGSEVTLAVLRDNQHQTVKLTVNVADDN